MRALHFLPVLLIVACSSNDDPAFGGSSNALLCVSGDEVACTCAGGAHGLQPCNPGGMSFGVCSCASGTGGGGSGAGGDAAGGGGAGGGSASGGGSGVCVPGDVISCYEGLDGTQDVGVCHAGTSTCAADGSGYGPCVGQVAPSAEDCATEADESCDGSPGPCPGPLWAKALGGSGDPRHVCIDASGNIHLLVSYLGSVDFGGGTVTSAGSYDVAIATFDSAGNYLWAKSFGSASQEIAAGCAGDAEGNVVLGVELYGGAVDFGGGPLASLGNVDTAYVKLDAAGHHVWSKRFGPSGSQQGTAVAIDAQGDILVTGVMDTAIDFGAGPPVGSGPMFLAKLDPDGEPIWSLRFGDNSLHLQAPFGLAVDENDNIAMAGVINGSVDFGGGSLTSAGGSEDVFVAKLGPLGNHIWSRLVGDAETQRAQSVAFDHAGRVLVTGYYLGAPDFGGGPLANGGSMPNFEKLFIASYDAAGSHVWSKGVNAVRLLGYGVAADASNDVVVVGPADGIVDFGGGPLVVQGDCDAFVAKFDSAGNYEAAHLFGDAGQQIAKVVTPGSAGEVVMAGTFTGNIDFGDGPLTTPATDTFIVKMIP